MKKKKKNENSRQTLNDLKKNNNIKTKKNNIEIKNDKINCPKTIRCIEPFNKYIHNIINFMTSKSKNIYNCHIFCHKIYDIFYCNIYNDLYIYLIQNIYMVDKINFILFDIKECKNKQIIGSEKIIDVLIKELNLLTNIIHEKIYECFNKYHKFYSDNYKSIKINNIILNKFISEKNNLSPIINSNYYSIIDEVKQFVLSNENIIKIDNFDWYTVTQYTDLINKYYNINFYNTKKQITNFIPVTINDENFIKEVKNENKLVKQIKKGDNKNIICELLNLDLNSDQYIIKEITYRNIGENKQYLPADVILNILDRAYDGYLSFLSKIQNGQKCNRQDYLNKNDKYNLFYTSSSTKIIKKNKRKYIRLSIGEYIAKNYKDISNNKKIEKIPSKNKILVRYMLENKKNGKGEIDGNYIYIRIPDKIKNKKIKLVNIVPMYEGYKYSVNFTYDAEKEQPIKYETSEIKNYLFGDLGICNLITFYDPTGKKQYIISGEEIKSINYLYNMKIDNLKCITKIFSNKDTSSAIRDLWIERENKINDYFDKICTEIIKTYEEKNCIVFGYNLNWKNKVNLGKINNQNFYQIPYKKLINKLKDKLERKGKQLILISEWYTSKCDSLNKELIGKHDKYDGERIKRGLFSSKTRKLINADMNGAINIGRKYFQKNGIKNHEINQEGIYNPQRIKIK